MPNQRSHRHAAALGTAALSLALLAACADDTTAPPNANHSLRAAPPSLSLAPQTGIDCGCTRTGPYEDPDPGAAPATSNGGSPGGRYTVTRTTSGGLVTITVKKAGVTVRSFPGLPSNVKFGFSPDQDRFVYHYLYGTAPNQTHEVYLYDLSRSGAPQVWQHQGTPVPSRIAFSPNGKRFLYARLASTNYVSLEIDDAATGTQRYATQYTFTNAPGTTADTLGMAAWGFSPDDQDRTFVLTYITGQTTAQWNAVNLDPAATNRQIVSETAAAAGYWQFSPCGDLIAIVRQSSQSQQSVRLVRTTDGSTVSGSSRTFAVGTLAIRTTSTDHIAALGGVDQLPRLAPNTAATACQSTAPALSAVSLTPSSVQGGATSTGKVTLTAAAQANGFVVTLSSGNGGVATTPASVTVPAGSTSATFSVTTHSVSTSTTVTISATAASVTKTASLGVTAPVVIPPSKALTPNPGSLQFANQPLGTTSAAQAVTLTSTGNTPVTISGIAASGDFAQSNNCPLSPNTLAVGTSCTIWVSFAPTATGSRTGAVIVTSDGTGSPQSIGLSGTGYVPVAGASVVPGAIGFGSLIIGTTTSGVPVKITSNGSAPLVISSVSIGGTNPWDFDVVADGCSGVTLNPGAYCMVHVSFEPFAAGGRYATLTIAHNAPGGSSAVALSGSGVKPPGGYIP